VARAPKLEVGLAVGLEPSLEEVLAVGLEPKLEGRREEA
jgi:hypothetical protein